MIALLLLFAASPVRVGSKQFTESVILAEIARQALDAEGIPAEHRRELGGTRVLWEALLAHQIDVYPEYTGTIAQELVPGARDLAAALRDRGVVLGPPLGFENTYALGMKRARALELGVRQISHLRAHPDLVLGLSNEFLQRGDGWPRLRATYALPQRARGLQHDLAYRALETGAIDATDLYSTDAEIRALDLLVLEDDRRAFPEYRAVFLMRAGLDDHAVRALDRLAGRIDPEAMIDMNARARLDKVPEARIASDFLRARLGAGREQRSEGLALRVWQRTLEHLILVSVSLAASIAVGIPLGILAARRRRLGQVVLAAAGVLQTIPSLALLVLMIPLLGIGSGPAIAALFLYGLLPIVRGTHAGLTGIAPELRTSAEALGLPPRARLRLVELPLASRSILSGVQTSAVINVGTATLGALIGAGGYGQSILTGIRLADTRIILEGAIPAALLALAVQAAFELVGRAFVPKGLRIEASKG